MPLYADTYHYLNCCVKIQRLHQITVICHVNLYNLSHHDWHLDTSHLIGKVRLKNKQKSCHIGSCQDIIKLCEIRDGLALCDTCTLSNDDVCKLIDNLLRVGITYCTILLYYCNYYYYCNPCKH